MCYLEAVIWNEEEFGALNCDITNDVHKNHANARVIDSQNKHIRHNESGRNLEALD